MQKPQPKHLHMIYCLHDGNIICDFDILATLNVKIKCVIYAVVHLGNTIKY